MAHVLTCRVIQAWGVPDEADKNRPFVRVKITDANNKVIQTKETRALEYGGDNPAWNEYLTFTGLDTPADYTITLEVADKNDKKGEAPDGVAKVPLSVLLAQDRLQQFREVIAGGWFSNAELRFGLCNYGTWGNSTWPSNKLSVKIVSASQMAEELYGGGGGGGMLSSLFVDGNDPYVYCELFNEKGKRIGNPAQTSVLKNAGKSADWNETLRFPSEVLTFPQAYTLKLSVWDKDTVKKDDPLGKYELKLSKLLRTPLGHDFSETLEGGKGAVLTFNVNSEGTWGCIDDRALCTAAPVEDLEEKKPHEGYYLKVTVLSCTGLSAGSKGNDGKQDPVCRLTLRDEWNNAIQTVTTAGKSKPKPAAKATAKTKPKAKPKPTGKAKNRKAKKEEAKKGEKPKKAAPKKGAKGTGAEPEEKQTPAKKPDVEWNETFEFKGIYNPGRCTLSLNVLDGEGEDSEKEAGKRLGEHNFVLGALDNKKGMQEFDEEIAGFFWKTTLKFQCDNLGAWGNDEDPANNKLYIRLDDATSLPFDVGTIFKDVADPYVFVELKDDEGDVIDKKQSKVKKNAGSNPKFDEELVFENIEEPAGCSIHITVWDSELGRDSKLGHTEVFLGELPMTSDYVSYHGTTMGGVCELNFALHTGGTWGNGIPVPPPEDPNKQKGCCSVM